MTSPLPDDGSHQRAAEASWRSLAAAATARMGGGGARPPHRRRLLFSSPHPPPPTTQRATAAAAMAKKLGKKARKFAHKHLQGGAKRSRKLRSQFNRRTRKDGKEREDGGRLDGDGDEEMRRSDSITMNTNDDVATLASSLEFPEDDNEFDGDLSDSDGYLSERAGKGAAHFSLLCYLDRVLYN